MGTIIEFNTVVLRGKNGRFILRGLNLAIEQGTFVKITGSRYGGKTEIMRLIGGMTRPDHGGVNVLGIPIHELDDEQMAEYRQKHIGYTSSKPGFHPSLSVLQNVTMPLTIQGYSKLDREQVGLQVLNSIGLTHIIHVFPKAISDLEMRLAGIARAFVAKPEIVILDGVFTDADDMDGKILQAIRTLSDTCCTRILFSGEQETDVPADREIHIENGSIRR